jgi:hypothetical protein
MGGMMGAGLFFAMGGILFMLGLISLQLGTMRQNGWAASAFIVLAFVGCLLLAGYMGMMGLMAMSLSGL